MTSFAHNTERNIAIAATAIALAVFIPETRAALDDPAYAYGGGVVLATVCAGLATAMCVAFALAGEWMVWRALFGAVSLAVASAFTLASLACALRVESAPLRLLAFLVGLFPVGVWAGLLVAWFRADGPLPRLEALIDRIDYLAAAPTDDADERLAKAILMFLGVFVLLASAVAARALAARGAPALATAFDAAALATAAGLVHFVAWRTRRVLGPLALAALLVLPLAAQHQLGGFAAAGGLGLVAVLAPLAALALHGPRASIAWFGAFALGALWVALEDPAPGPGALWFAEALLLAGGVAFILLRHFVAERARLMAALAAEQARSEGLLLNILPGPIAERLKRQPGSIADEFAEVSVLFADIVGFTTLAARTSPGALVALLNELFSEFDALAAKHGVEKIKTIGDAYMACAGLPVTRPDHARVAAELALDMQDALGRFAATHGVALKVRIGINSGPVVAGVIGVKKFIYDLWGDTVNTASRMESHGVPGAIQVTATTRALLGDAYEFEDRGEIEVKGKGLVRTSLLLRRRASA